MYIYIYIYISIYNKNDFGLYRDDGLAFLKNVNCKKVDCNQNK